MKESLQIVVELIKSKGFKAIILTSLDNYSKSEIDIDLKRQVGAIEFNKSLDSRNLFDFFKLHSGGSKPLILRDDLILENENLISIIEGAVCRSTDSGDHWTMSFEDEEFVFKGQVIFFTSLNESQIRSSRKLYYVVRDSVII
ncbi:MAG: hypothetical protein RJQ09_16975 [Cyclobacteriaceae bacterium]